MKINLKKIFVTLGFMAFEVCQAQGAFPNKPVHVIVGAPAGGPMDVMARLLSQPLKDSLSQPIVIENRPGAASALAASVVAKSRPDGYTLFLSPFSHATYSSLTTKPLFDSTKDFEAVALIGKMPLVVLVSKSIPANSLQELVAIAKAKPNSLNFASGGTGAVQHLAGEALKAATGTQMTHVPYTGTGPAMNDLIGGQIHFIIEPLLSAIPLIQGGRVKAIATTGVQRPSSLPNVPTAQESGVNMEITAWYGYLAPAGTPPAVVTRLNGSVNSVLADPAIQSRLVSLGIDITPGTPAQFTGFLNSEVAKWKQIIQKSGMTIE